MHKTLSLGYMRAETEDCKNNAAKNGGYTPGVDVTGIKVQIKIQIQIVCTSKIQIQIKICTLLTCIFLKLHNRECKFA